jgi:hypothetical protein
MAAVGEERAIALAEMDVTCVELGEVRDERGRLAALARGHMFQPGFELVVGEPAQRGEEFVVHICLYHA